MSHLPQEVIKFIFQNLEKQDMIQCRLVCLTWYGLGTQGSFRHLLIADDHHFESFLKLQSDIPYCRFSGLGQFIKTIRIGAYRYTEKTRFSYSSFEKLVKYCPFVEVFDAEEQGLSSYMLTIDSQNQWRYLKKLPPVCNRFDHCIKYSSCLTKLTTGMEKQQDMNFLRPFRSLTQLCLPSLLPVTSVEDLQFITQTCPKLTSLHGSLSIKENLELADSSALGWSCLRRLTFYNYSGKLPLGFARYVSHHLACLDKLHLIMDTCHHNEAYDDLIDWALTRLKKTFQLNLTIKSIKGPKLESLIRHYIRCMLLPNFTKNKGKEICALLKLRRGDSRDCIEMNAHWSKEKTRKLVCHLELTLPLGDKTFPNYLQYAIGSIDQLIVKGQLYIADLLSQHNLRNLTLEYSMLRTCHFSTWKSIETLTLSHSHVVPGFFHDIPQLKTLVLVHNNYPSEIQTLSSRVSCLAFSIQLKEMVLDKFEIETDKRETLIVNTSRGSQFYLMNKIPKRILEAEWEIHKKTNANRIFFTCERVAKVKINGVEFEFKE